MFRDEKNLKDSIKDTSSPSPLQEEGRGEVGLFHNSGLVSYTKTQKLITALYMVTDIIDKDEPLRNKLRTLGVEILSDMHLIGQNNIGHPMSFINSQITELMSFLNIASDLNIISEMNCNILRKEFSELDKAISESVSNKDTLNRRVNLAEFFESFPEESDPYPPSPLLGGRSKEGFGMSRENSKGHLPMRTGNSIGVQKGSTLLKALKQVSMPTRPISGSDKNLPIRHQVEGLVLGFELLRKQRHESIKNIIKLIGTGATIKDIKDKVQANSAQFSSLVSCGEKTFQRELIAMVKNGVLYKTGEKRWSRYFIRL